MSRKTPVQKIRVLIVDDHAIVREALRSLLQSQEDIEVVGEAIDGREAISKTKSLKPDVVLMDITMPGIDGLEATRQIKDFHPDVQIMVLTMHEDNWHFFNVLSAGASGYFVKGGSSAELVSALRTVWHGDLFLYPTMAKYLLDDYVKRAGTGNKKSSLDGLTLREREILRLLAEGRTNQEMADLLVLSPPPCRHTVRTS